MTRAIYSGHYAELPCSVFPFRLDRTLMAALSNAIYRCVQHTCRVCGCSQYDPCEDGCWWIEKDLCSACEGEPAAPMFHLKIREPQRTRRERTAA
jgi:hypothetical protein